MTSWLIGLGLGLLVLAGSTETIWLAVLCGTAGLACLVPAAVEDNRRSGSPRRADVQELRKPSHDSRHDRSRR